MGTDTVQRTEVDGVPTLWLPSTRPSLRASLMFRRGQADETLPTRGRTHLLEHLALDGRETGALDTNGSVALWLTSFDAYGDPADVVQHFGAVCGWLSDPQLDRMAHALGILTAESNQRVSGAGIGGALIWRYGAQGPGLGGYPELGLRRTTTDDMLGLAAANFTRDNCVLVLDGPPPATMALPLPAGDRCPSPSAMPCDERLPNRTAYPLRSGQVVLSGLVGRSTAAASFSRILLTRVRDFLRGWAGISYSPWVDYERIDADIAHVTVGADVDDEQMPYLTTSLFEVIDKLATGDVSAEEVRADGQRVLRQIDDLNHRPAEAWNRGVDTLLGFTSMDFATLRAEVTSLTPDQLRGPAQEFRDTLMVGLPPALRRHRLPVSWMVQPHLDITNAESFPSRDAPVTRQSVLLSEDTVAVRTGTVCRGVRFEDLAGVLVYDDGRRELIAKDAYTATIEPTLWRDGPRLVDLIDRRVPDDLKIPMPGRQIRDIPQPTTHTWQRLWARANTPLVRHRLWAVLFVLSVLAIVPLLVLLSSMPNAPIGLAFLPSTAVVLALAVTEVSRSRR